MVITETEELRSGVESNGVAGPDRRGVSLAGDHRLVVARGTEEDVLQVQGSDGTLCVEVVVTETGARVRLEGGDVRIRSSGRLSLDGESVAIRGRDGVSLQSGADMEVDVAGVIKSEAHAQRLIARRGDTTIYANDDVRLDGERIRMNC